MSLKLTRFPLWLTLFASISCLRLWFPERAGKIISYSTARVFPFPFEAVWMAAIKSIEERGGFVKEASKKEGRIIAEICIGQNFLSAYAHLPEDMFFSRGGMSLTFSLREKNKEMVEIVLRTELVAYGIEKNKVKNDRIEGELRKINLISRGVMERMIMNSIEHYLVKAKLEFFYD